MCDLIRQQTVNLFRHGAVEGPESSLHVANWNQELGAHQRRCERRVDVPVNQDNIRLPLPYNRLEPCHDFRCLPGMAARTDPKIYVRFRNPQLGKEGAGHVGVVMLTGMNQALLCSRLFR